MIETGFLVFLSLVVMLFWLNTITILRFFGRPWTLELPFGILAYILHYGTFSGMMAAAVAIAMCAIFVRAGRFLVGYVLANVYHPGIIILKGF